MFATQQGGIFPLDGFDEQCSGNPRLPVHGIGTLDADGIKFAAVKTLEARTRSMEAEIAALRAELAAMKEMRR